MPTDVARDGVDLAVRYGPGGWAGLEAEKLLDEEIFPVCNSGFQKRHKGPLALCGSRAEPSP